MLKYNAGSSFSVMAVLSSTVGIQGHKVPWNLAKPGRRSTRWPEHALSSSLRPGFNMLLYHPSSTVILSMAPEPSHQPACNWIILMSVVILPTYTKAKTHKKVLERKDYSAVQSWDAEGDYYCHGRLAWKGGIYLIAWQLLLSQQMKPPIQLESLWSLWTNFFLPQQNIYKPREWPKGFHLFGELLAPSLIDVY